MICYKERNLFFCTFIWRVGGWFSKKISYLRRKNFSFHFNTIICLMFVLLHKPWKAVGTFRDSHLYEHSCSRLEKFHKPNPQIPDYTRSIETKRFKSKIKIGIRLRSCTNLSGRKKDSVTIRRCTSSEITLWESYLWLKLTWFTASNDLFTASKFFSVSVSSTLNILHSCSCYLITQKFQYRPLV